MNRENAVWVNVTVTTGHCMRVSAETGETQKFDDTCFGRFEQVRFGGRMRRKYNDPTIICLGVEHKATRYLVDVDQLKNIAIEIKD